ncbi:MAG: hypothetical protein ACP5LP_03405 [Candidatus Micrarchaeia archaeon]
MSEQDLERITNEEINKGGVLAKLYFDVQSQDKDNLQPFLLDLINERLLKEPGVVYCYGYIDEPIRNEDLFITSGIVTILVQDFAVLAKISLNYSPVGVEILKPLNEIKLKIGDGQRMLLDLSQYSLDFSRYLLEHVMSPEEFAALQKQIKNRIDYGKELFEKSKNKKDEK